MAPRTDFPPVRACLFDMDGLLLDTEDLYTECINTILAEHERPLLPWDIKAKLQGRPGPDATRIFHEWAKLPIGHDEYHQKLSAIQRKKFPKTKPLPGIPELLQNLGRTRYYDHKPTTDGKTAQRVHIALATSSHEANFRLKSDHLTELFSVFPSQRRVLGDDTRIAPGRGKPNPDIFLLALKTINESLSEGEKPITPEECLVFEDSVPGVEAGRRAGMRVIWCPHKGLLQEYSDRQKQVLAGRTGEAGEVDMHQVGELDDGWAEYLPTLEDFPYGKFGMTIPPVEVDNEPFVKEDVNGNVVA
ncbi:haloacid dehalogenase-like hydrolase [Colletotrichum orchidophilum]|uniref:Haloacid dehalogenase-like hydrolase n=1 Tax=Colletotrichum orchidophilum TaxID=1209926 RepID=A0A1G4AYH3_9PEZI|nr:haloacid dehalogenase-like hydrolase [Colletotrichum orchidophilum]OHE94092.1 haloacid dehalogenase-like hydrolase [Colletotrichum orchidophilum]